MKDGTSAVEHNTDGLGTNLLPLLASIGKQLQCAKKKKDQLLPDPKSWSEWPEVIPEKLSLLTWSYSWTLSCSVWQLFSMGCEISWSFLRCLRTS